MAKKQSKPVKNVDNLYPNRDRTIEIAEGKFTCHIETCKVALKFRMLKFMLPRSISAQLLWSAIYQEGMVLATGSVVNLLDVSLVIAIIVILTTIMPSMVLA